MALDCLTRYLASDQIGHFIAPDVRKWAAREGRLPEPPNAYAWGSVFATAARRGLIRAVGFTVYGDDVMHSQSVRTWSRAEALKP